jgi:hypothetical protein
MSMGLEAGTCCQLVHTQAATKFACRTHKLAQLAVQYSKPSRFGCSGFHPLKKQTGRQGMLLWCAGGVDL